MQRAWSTLVSLPVWVVIMNTSPLYAAPPFDPQQQPLGIAPPMALSTVNLFPSGGKVYRPWFENGAWQGDLIELDIGADGIPRTTVDLTTTPPTSPSGGNWSARIHFAQEYGNDPQYWTNRRRIITSDGNGHGIPFRWQDLNDAQRQALDPGAFAVSAHNSRILDFIRGDRRYEKPSQVLRQRFSVLGDIVHSRPRYVGPPQGGFSFDNYLGFKRLHQSRSGRIYIGANDGMLHAFDAGTGREVFAYIPASLISDLHLLTATPYQHHYFVDGPLSSGDALLNGHWHTVLVGALGAGGKVFYALDITDPDTTSEADASHKLLWEINADNDDDLGYSYSVPVIARLNDGKWYAIVGNGYNSAKGKALLYIIDLANGTVIRKLATDGSGSAAQPNGLSSPSLVDIDNDFKADYAYAGDINGNMWKFDLSGKTPDEWVVSYGAAPLFAGSTQQAITTAPDITPHPHGGYLVSFGTGRLLTPDDRNDTSRQSIITVWDKGTTPGTPKLLSQSLQQHSVGSERVRTSTNATPVWTGADPNSGWRIDLPAGERVLTAPQIHAGRVQLLTTNPYITGGENWLIEPDFLSGGAPATTLFDLNDDGMLTGSDRVDANGDGDVLDPADIPVAWFRGDGYMSRPTIARVSESVDSRLINRLILPFADTCVNACSGGFQGGSIDVATDSPAGGHDAGQTCTDAAASHRQGIRAKELLGLGGPMDGHHKEYDKAHGVTDVDLFGLEPLCAQPRPDGTQVNKVQKLNRISEVTGLDPDKLFVVVVANADLSPAAELVIGGKRWNAVIYQKMLQKQLAQANGQLPLVDDEGDSLVFTLRQLQTAGGLRIHFNDRAIIDGWIHPTSKACVVKKLLITNERWRNGALTIQIVDAGFLGELISQTPSVSPDDPKTVNGGLHLNQQSGQNAFLYETALFWDFGKLYEKITGNDIPCYGDPQWKEALKIEQQGITYEEFTVLFAKELNKLAREKLKLQQLIDEGASQAAIAKQTKKVNKALREVAQGLQYVKNIAGGSDGSRPGTSSGVPAVVGGGTISDTPVAGADLSAYTGRRSWAEIPLP